MPGFKITLGTSVPCPVLFLSCLTVLPPSLPDRGTGVQAWLPAGVLLWGLELGDMVRVSEPKVVIPVLTAGAVTFVVTDSPSSVGVTMSPARYSHCQMPETAIRVSLQARAIPRERHRIAEGCPRPLESREMT